MNIGEVTLYLDNKEWFMEVDITHCTTSAFKVALKWFEWTDFTGFVG